MDEWFCPDCAQNSQNDAEAVSTTFVFPLSLFKIYRVYILNERGVNYYGDNGLKIYPTFYPIDKISLLNKRLVISIRTLLVQFCNKILVAAFEKLEKIVVVKWTANV